MKSLPIASLALVLALSGCASSPTLEEQTKLVEYEKCLEAYERLTYWSLELAKLRTYARDYDYLQLSELIGTYTYEGSLEECKLYRP